MHTPRMFVFSWVLTAPDRRASAPTQLAGSKSGFLLKSIFPWPQHWLPQPAGARVPTRSTQVAEGSGFLISQHCSPSPDQGRGTTSSQGQMCWNERCWQGRPGCEAFGSSPSTLELPDWQKKLTLCVWLESFPLQLGGVMSSFPSN